jgi:cytochrome c biogenesis protein CcdA
MCFVFSVVFAALSVNFYTAGEVLYGTLSGIVSLLFIILMSRNVLKTIKQKKELKNKTIVKENKDDSNEQ